MSKSGSFNNIWWYFLYFFFKYSNVKYSTSAPILSCALETRQICQRCGKSWNWIFCYFAAPASNSVQFPQKTENSYLLLGRWIGLLFLHKFGQLWKWKEILFLVGAGSFRQSHIKQSGCLMDSFKQKYPLLWSLAGNLTRQPSRSSTKQKY